MLCPPFLVNFLFQSRSQANYFYALSREGIFEIRGKKVQKCLIPIGVNRGADIDT